MVVDCIVFCLIKVDFVRLLPAYFSTLEVRVEVLLNDLARLEGTPTSFLLSTIFALYASVKFIKDIDFRSLKGESPVVVVVFLGLL